MADIASTRRRLTNIVADHQRWLADRTTGKRGNLAHYDLTEWQFSGINLSRSLLRGIGLMGANLEGADLSYTNLFLADLEGANLKGANLSGADLRGARLQRADLTDARLEGANLARSSSSGELENSIDDAEANRASASMVESRVTDLSHSCIRGAVMINATLSECDMSGADLRGSDLSGANLSNTILAHANLSDIRTDGALFEGAFTFGANLDADTRDSLAKRGAHFTLEGRTVDLPMVIQHHQAWVSSEGSAGQCADLTLRDLRGAQLAGMDLRSARLRRCDLSGANFAGTTLIMADLTGSNLAGAVFSDANLSGCTLRSTNLFDCRFDRARLMPMVLESGAEPWPASFENARMHLATFSHARMQQVVLRGAIATADTLASLRTAGVPSVVLRRMTVERLS